MKKVSVGMRANHFIGIMFLESSALNANNVSTAFEMLVASIYEAL